MEITEVKISLTPHLGALKAFASISIGDEFIVHDLRILETEDQKLFVAMPVKKIKDSRFGDSYKDIAHPLKPETRSLIEKAVLAKYNQAVKKESSIPIVKNLQPEDFLLVYCMTPDEKTGEDLSRHLLSLKLIACANLFPPGRSFYEWEGQLQNSSECALICKTKKSLYRKMAEELVKKHPYDCPGLCAVPLSQAHPPFLKWMDKECSFKNSS